MLIKPLVDSFAAIGGCDSGLTQPIPLRAHDGDLEEVSSLRRTYFAGSYEF